MDLTRRNRAQELTSYIGIGLSWLMAALVVGVCFFIIGYLVQQGFKSMSWQFFTTDPSGSIAEGQGGGVRIPLVGTAFLIVGSMLLAVPLAIASAVYLAEYMDERNLLTRIIRVGLEVLAGVPSVVFGMFGLALFTLPALAFFSSSGADNASAAFGRSFFVASIIMGVHVLPFIVKVAEEAIRSVPASYRAGAAALGMTKWRAVRKIVLPAAAPGIATGVVLGMGLVAGDTAIVSLTLGATMTMAVDNWWQASNLLTVLRGTGSTLTTFIYFNSPAGEGNSPDLAFAAALVLIGLVVVLNVIAMLIARVQSNAGRA
jgi:phosphate transport system permease protein